MQYGGAIDIVFVGTLPLNPHVFCIFPFWLFFPFLVLAQNYCCMVIATFELFLLFFQAPSSLPVAGLFLWALQQDYFCQCDEGEEVVFVSDPLMLPTHLFERSLPIWLFIHFFLQALCLLLASILRALQLDCLSVYWGWNSRMRAHLLWSLPHFPSFATFSPFLPPGSLPFAGLLLWALQLDYFN